MPERMMKESILTCEQLNTVSFQAECFFKRLWMVVDDFGRYDGRNAVLRASLYALKLDRVSEPDVGKWKRECAEAGLVRMYTVGSREYLEIPKDLFGQRLRALKSKWPDPPASAGICPQPPADADIRTGVGDGVEVDSPCSPPPGGVQAKDFVPHQDFVQTWNAIGPPFATVQAWNDRRKNALRVRWADRFFRDNWRKALEILAQSDFHKGKGRSGWIASVDWFLKAGNAEKLIEQGPQGGVDQFGRGVKPKPQAPRELSQDELEQVRRQALESVQTVEPDPRFVTYGAEDEA